MLKKKIEEATTITILSHLNPDADTIGTSLGIYSILSQDRSKRIEVVNASNALPIYLDFLPNYKKIKKSMDFKDSLIIACDCGSIDRLGFDLDGRDIINIDHHSSNTNYGSTNIVFPKYASASQVAYKVFSEIYDISSDSATCFYTALLSDTRYFTTSSVDEEVFSVAKSLLEKGAKSDEIVYNFTQRKSLASIRILEKALSSLTLYSEAKVATLVISQDDILSTGATMPDMEGIVDYGRSLSTVEISIFVIELSDGVRVSLRSKSIDISKLALLFNGGGHKYASGFTLKQCGLQEIIDKIISKIEELGLIK